MRRLKDPCQNQNPSAFTYMIETLDVIPGTNQPSTTQINCFKIQVSNPQAQFTESTNLPSPPSPILKKDNTVLDSTRHHHVHTNRCRKHHLHRGKNNIDTTRKRTTKESRSYSITSKHSTRITNSGKPP